MQAKEPFHPSKLAYAVVVAGAANSVFRCRPPQAPVCYPPWRMLTRVPALPCRVLPPRRFATALAVATLIRYFYYVSAVVRQVCAHLGIQCFRIKVQ